MTIQLAFADRPALDDHPEHKVMIIALGMGRDAESAEGERSIPDGPKTNVQMNPGPSVRYPRSMVGPHSH